MNQGYMDAVLDLVAYPSTPGLSSLTITECAYGLRFVELNFRGTREPWSVRQTAIYHSYKLDKRVSTWVMISASTKIKDSLNNYVRSSENISALNPFEIHVILLDTALGNWRSYIIYLTEQISKQVFTNSSFLRNIGLTRRFRQIKYLSLRSMIRIHCSCLISRNDRL